MSELSPLMAQYRDIKHRYGDCILLFRVGDFYETFYEDAVDVASILNITLTTRDKNKPNPIPLAGVPFHAADTYLPRLLAAGRKIAVCEQMEDPALAKGIVRRDVVEVLTPGTSLGPQVLAELENNYCLCVHASGKGRMAVAWIDVGTGECACGEADDTAFLHLVQGKRIRELVYACSTPTSLANLLDEHLEQPFVAELPDTSFDEASARDVLTQQFGARADAIAASLSPGELIAVGSLIGHCLALRGGAMPQVVDITRVGATDRKSVV